MGLDNRNGKIQGDMRGRFLRPRVFLLSDFLVII